jgi:hypothetical protein
MQCTPPPTSLRKQARAHNYPSVHCSLRKEYCEDALSSLGMALPRSDAGLHAGTQSRVARRCDYCRRLSITHLVEYAKVDLPDLGWLQPDPSTYFHHHNSIDALKTSADAGCDFCSLIVDTLNGYEEEDEWRASANNWKGSGCDPSRSLFTAAQQLPTTEISIALSSGRSHGAHRTTRDGATLLDTLIVNIGPVQSGDGESTRDDAWEAPDFPHLCFKLTAPQRMAIVSSPLRYKILTRLLGKSIVVDTFQVGQYPVDGNTSATSNFAIARAWLANCKATHPHCLATIIPELPTRVIDVGLAGTHLKIHHSEGERAEYVALSHCWGGPITPLLTKETSEAFHRALHYSDLPPNFQDAITITRQLCIPYLWIDSLCIVQDSKEDWEQQSKKMGQIYRGSTLTLSALASAGSSCGIFPTQPKVCPVDSVAIPLYDPDDHPPKQEYMQIERIDDREETLTILEAFGPLSSRGWCLQESVLPSRQLYYGLKQIYWRCPNGYIAADGSTDGLNVPHRHLDALERVLLKGMLRTQIDDKDISEAAVLKDYYTIVQEYSQRKLTYGSDKLPGFAGVSSLLHSFFGGEYLVGIWSSHLPLGLLWRHDARTCKHVQPYRAPSWSWAVTDEDILYGDNFYSDDIAVLRKYPSTIQLLDHQITLKNELNPYHEVTFASITVRALTSRFVRSTQHFKGYILEDHKGKVFLDDEPPRATHEERQNDDDSEDAATSSTFPDIFFVEDERGPYMLAMTSSSVGYSEFEIKHSLFTEEEYLAVVVHVNEDDENETGSKCTSGLIVRPVAGLDKGQARNYERVGMFQFDEFTFSWLEKFEWKDLTLV